MNLRLRFYYSLLYFYIQIVNTYSLLYRPHNYISIKNIKTIYRNNKLINNIYLDDNSISNVSNINLSLEHVCPQSFLKNVLYAKQDMHNLFLTNNYINLQRSNYKFIDEIYTDYGKYFYKIENNNLELTQSLSLNNKFNYKNDFNNFVPIITSRGKIARTIAYMKLTYPKLCLDNIIDLEILVNWDNLYPPTDEEFQRNELIYNYQGNINPFTEKVLDINTVLN